jgi:hypothetical protein
MKRPSGFAVAALIAVLAGCATPKPKPEIVFFPPAPQPPRIQFLTSFSSQKDIEKESAFRKFIFGETPKWRLDKPYGVAIFDGKIYVCDTNQGVFVFDLRARTLETLKGAKGPGRLVQPLNISIDADGNKYVSDPVRGQVLAFDRGDEYLKAYGTAGTWKPVDAVTHAGRLFVADIQNGTVQVFDIKTGANIRTIGKDGEPEKQLRLPTNIALDGAGRLRVSDAARFQIVTYELDGRYVGVTGKLGNNLGHFARPRGIGLDREDRLYAVDAAFNNVQIFNNQGRLLLYFGAEGHGPGSLVLPAKVVVDYDNISFFQQYVVPNFQLEYLVIVTSQLGERLVNVFGYGRDKGVSYPSDDDLTKRILEKFQPEPGEPQKPAETGPGTPDKQVQPAAP